LRRIWVDALVYQPENVAHLIRTLGASQVVLGTDYPFDMGEERPIEVLDKVADLSRKTVSGLPAAMRLACWGWRSDRGGGAAAAVEPDRRGRYVRSLRAVRLLDVAHRPIRRVPTLSTSPSTY